MNFRSGPVKKPPQFKSPNDTVNALPVQTPAPAPGMIAGPSAGPAKRFPGIRGMIGKK